MARAIIKDTNIGGNLGQSFLHGILAGYQQRHQRESEQAKLSQKREEGQALARALGLIGQEELPYQDIQQQIGAQQPEQPFQQQEQQPMNLSELIASAYQNPIHSGVEQLTHSKLSNLLGMTPEAKFQKYLEQLPAAQQQQVAQQMQPQQQMGQASQMMQQQPQERRPSQEELLALNPQHALQIAQLRQRQEAQKQKQELQKEQFNKKEIASRFKETKAERNEILKRGKAAKGDLEDLDRLEELEKEGKLDTPGYIEGLKEAGFDVANLMEPGTVEYQKIVNNFLRNGREYFGGKVTNNEMEQFLKTLPNLSASPEGRKRVIANLKRIKRLEYESVNALKEVMAENKGIPPLDIAEQVDDKLEKKRAHISKLFKEDLKKPVPKGQSKLTTALQVGAGKAAGLAGNVISKAAPIAAGAIAGSRIGSIAGLPGAGIGAAGGALYSALSSLLGK